ncbi:hypothetical protein EUX98_g5754 [Antrodiella citrinella]|uniref:Methyltransferase type 11 domain-containing protein n=1 Tax=Antrodiella citrinella TaxID=2447956 RepID=A0A4S4MSK2_9APHY|nr:hypothetical protein EUX98_g5754 [Antrodiella citrinella]
MANITSKPVPAFGANDALKLDEEKLKEWRLNMPLEEKWYTLADDELEFYRKETGIQDAEKIKAHILQVQADAYKVYPYPCIRRFSFTTLKISRYPAYQDLLKLGRERSGALFLDIGCCCRSNYTVPDVKRKINTVIFTLVGNDVRKAVADGFPVDQALASDLRPAFWDLGHTLFKSTPESFPVPFLAGDVFDSNFLSVVPPFTTKPTAPAPSLKDITSLTPLNGHLSAIHASAFFHLFDEAGQTIVAKAFAGLLSPEPGSIIFGSHRGELQKGYRTKAHKDDRERFGHSPETWQEMWHKDVFGEGKVKTWAILKETERKDMEEHFGPGVKFYLLVWSVTRL